MDWRTLEARLWQDVLRLRAAEGYLRAGWPRFFSYFTRDACIAAWQLLDLDREIARDTLVFAAGTQGMRFDWRNGEEPGKIAHQACGKGDRAFFPDRLGMWFYGSRQYFSIDTTPLWVILMHRWWEREGDAAVPLVRNLRPNLIEALTWIIARLRRDSFLVYRRRNPLWFSHQGWRDGFRNRLKMPTTAALADVQAYAYAALRGGAELLVRCFGSRSASYLENEAEELRVRFNERFWWPEEGTYVFALAGRELEQVRRMAPDPGMCLFSGIIPDDRVASVVERLFQPDLWTPYGFRSLAKSEALFRPDSYHLGSVWPFQSWLIWEGLKQYDARPEFRVRRMEIRNAMLGAHRALGCIPECFKVSAEHRCLPSLLPNANPIQAWSVCALLAMLAVREDE